MNDIHIQMQLVYIVFLSATGYCYSIIDSISLYTVFFLVAGVRKIRARDTIGPMACRHASHDQFVFLLFLVFFNFCVIYITNM